ncbi:RTX toxin [Lysinibacillus fusiformis]
MYRKRKCLVIAILLTLICSFCFQEKVAYAASVNRPPIVVASEIIPKQSMTLGQEKIVIDLSKLFYDADNDPLILKAITETVGIVTTEVSSNLLTLEALSPGKTKIKISADDRKLGRASSSFEIEVLPKSNNIPIVTQLINDQTGHVGDPPILIDASNVFTDEDNDPLTLSVSSNDESVATAQLNSQMISIELVGIGKSVISVQADDGNGGSETTTFEVTVTSPPNQPPVVAQPISNQLGIVGDVITIDGSGIFSDADNDVLTVNVSSSDESIATVQINAQTITVLPIAAGVSTITVQADDGKGGQVSTSFLVTVTTPTVNHSPKVAKTISNQRATMGGDSWNVLVDDIFSDDDNDPLTLTVSSSNRGVVTASLNGTSLKITQHSLGTSIITITADDGKGGQVSTSFIASVDAPGFFISDFVQNGEYNDVLEIYNATMVPLSNYKVEIQQYNLIFKQHTVQTLNIPLIHPNTNFVVIHSYFYDFFDMTVSPYFNEEFVFRDATKITVSITLKDSNGNVIDMLGARDSSVSILQSSGGYIRDKRLQSGTSNFNHSEWLLLPKDDYSTIGRY